MLHDHDFGSVAELDTRRYDRSRVVDEDRAREHAIANVLPTMGRATEERDAQGDESSEASEPFAVTSPDRPPADAPSTEEEHQRQQWRELKSEPAASGCGFRSVLCVSAVPVSRIVDRPVFVVVLAIAALSGRWVEALSEMLEADSEILLRLRHVGPGNSDRIPSGNYGRSGDEPEAASQTPARGASPRPRRGKGCTR